MDPKTVITTLVRINVKVSSDYKINWKKMAKPARVAVGVFFGLTSIILIGIFYDSVIHRARDLRVVHNIPQYTAQDLKRTNSAILNNYTHPEDRDYLRKSQKTCKPQNNIVFVKTHKTASSTTASIFDTYAYKNMLTMAVPPDDMAYMHQTKLFTRDMVRETTDAAKDWRKNVGFNIFSCHARYNKPEMDAVVHNAKYITILRDPGSQFVSAFVYFHFDQRFVRKFGAKERAYSNVIEEYMDDPKGNIDLVSDHTLVHVLHNEQFFDLGLDTKYANDWEKIDATIAKLDSELDLVIITEYYDESLIVMRDMLCWSTEDIIYYRSRVKGTTTAINVSLETQNRIRQWNAADMRLYQHFNRTLWRRIAEYGPSFDEELRNFRRRLKTVTEDDFFGHRVLMRKILKRMQDMNIYY